MNEKQIALIRRVQEICSFWDATAQSAAIEAARSDDKENRILASQAVARSDAVHYCEKRILKAINQYWSAL